MSNTKEQNGDKFNELSYNIINAINNKLSPDNVRLFYIEVLSFLQINENKPYNIGFIKKTIYYDDKEFIIEEQQQPTLFKKKSYYKHIKTTPADLSKIKKCFIMITEKYKQYMKKHKSPLYNETI